MIIVNVFTDDSIPALGHGPNNAHDVTLLVDHDDGQTYKTRFEIAWKKTLDIIKEAHPKSWNMDMVYSQLRRDGWNIIICRDALEVSY